jgi:type I restriction enzyme M protein
MLKTKDVPKELIKFNSLFFEFQYRHDLNRVFDDLLTVIVCTMGHETQEPLYLETIAKYERKELDALCKLFAELMQIYSKHTADDWCDPLGDYYECLAGNYKKSNFGQFFTPKPLCDMMTRMMQEPDNWGIKINDPACGSGRMILASNQFVKGNYFVCQDLDPICCKMTAINLCFHEIRAEVHCRNSLLMDAPRFSLATNYEYWKSKTKSIFYYPSA